MVSAIMQSVSGEENGNSSCKRRRSCILFMVHNQLNHKLKWYRHVKKHKAGFVVSDSNVKSGTSLREVIELSRKNRTFYSNH